MYALIARPGNVDGFRLAEVPEPEPGPEQVHVEVRHASVNYGEARYLGATPSGATLGHDAAGHVVRAAADGTGPAVGDQVIGFGPGAWAERAVFGTDSVAVVPERLDLADAAALPMAGVTALRTLRAAGSLLGRRVLVTGASGGVGRLAVQLARRGGAYVIASVGSPQRGEGLAALGAHQVMVGLDHVDGPVDVVLENVCVAHLVAAWNLLKPGGVLQNIGWASNEAAVFPVLSTFTPGAAKTLQSYGDSSKPGPDLATLVSLAGEGDITVPVGWRGSWRHVGEAIENLLGRRLSGNAVIDID